MEKTQLGKIQEVCIGWCGYQEAMIGIHFTIGGEGWGVGDYWAYWGTDRLDSAQWSEQDRIDALGKIMMRIKDLLVDAKVQEVSELAGIPVEVTFDGNTLKSWRVLKEVL